MTKFQTIVQAGTHSNTTAPLALLMKPKYTFIVFVSLCLSGKGEESGYGRQRPCMRRS